MTYEQLRVSEFYMSYCPRDHMHVLTSIVSANICTACTYVFIMKVGTDII